MIRAALSAFRCGVIRKIANAALVALSGGFERLYSPIDQRSIPPERLMRALPLQAFYSIHSEDEIRALLSRGAELKVGSGNADGITAVM